MNNSTSGMWYFLFAAALIGTVAYGWIWNIVSLVGMDWSASIGIEGVLRIIGIVIAPIGVVMGIFV